MTIRLEIVGKGKRRISVAFYYPVSLGNQQARANDQSRTPAGLALSPSEVTGLKDGSIFELVRSFSIYGFSRNKMKVRLEAAWTEQQAEALAAYLSAYKDLGISMDDTGTWS